MTSKSGTYAISDDAVQAKTGKHWDDWFAVLDAFDAARQGHKAAAAHLVEAHGVSGWWAQGITVRYEQTRGLRDVGQQSDRLFAVSVQRTIDAPADRVWRALTDPATVAAWACEAPAPAELPHEGARFLTADGKAGTWLNVVPNARLRHNWERGAGKPELVEWTLTAKGEATTLRLQHTKIATKADADQLKPGWTKAVEALRDLVEKA